MRALCPTGRSEGYEVHADDLPNSIISPVKPPSHKGYPQFPQGYPQYLCQLRQGYTGDFGFHNACQGEKIDKKKTRDQKDRPAPLSGYFPVAYIYAEPTAVVF